MNKITPVIIFFLCFLCTAFKSVARTFLSEADSSKNVSISFNTDFVSRYIWRGLPLSLNPNIQPYASLTFKNLSFGAWGSYALSAPYAEVDLYLSYNLSVFTLTLNDYYNEDENDLTANNYFKWNNSNGINTPHALEGVLTYNGTEGLPLSVTAATFFYGNDKDTVNNKNYYSTYLEVAYKLTVNETELKLFAGGTVNKGLYANKAAFVNIGVTLSREIKISNTFSLPVFTSLIMNPYAKDIFFTVGMTF
jgi:hypothetical protein